MIWYWIVGGALVGLLFLFITCYFCLRHTDKKKEESERSKYMYERMKKIEENNKVDMRNSVKIPRKEFDDLRDMAALHPDFA